MFPTSGTKAKTQYKTKLPNQHFGRKHRQKIEMQRHGKKTFQITFPSFCHAASKRQKHFTAVMSIYMSVYKLLKYCFVFSDFYDDIH